MRQLQEFYHRHRLQAMADASFAAMNLTVGIGFMLWPNQWAALPVFAAGACAVFAFMCFDKLPPK